MKGIILTDHFGVDNLIDGVSYCTIKTITVVDMLTEISDNKIMENYISNPWLLAKAIEDTGEKLETTLLPFVWADRELFVLLIQRVMDRVQWWRIVR